MSKSKSTKKISSALAAVILAVLIVCVCAAGCIATGVSGGQGADAVNTASAFAKQQVADFSNNSTRTNAVYTSKVLRQACVAAAMYTGKPEELENIATILSLDTIIVADEKAKVVASYPEGAVTAASLKEIDGAKELVPVAKGIAVKKMSEVTKSEDGACHVYAGAARQDAAGAVVLYMATEDYAEVSGETLAESCGTNVIIEKDGKRFSSNFTAAKDSAISDLGVAEDGKAYTVTVDGKSYQAQAATTENYRVLTAVEPSAAAGGVNPLIVIIIASAAALIIGCVVMFAVGKKQDA